MAAETVASHEPAFKPVSLRARPGATHAAPALYFLYMFRSVVLVLLLPNVVITCWR